MITGAVVIDNVCRV